RIVEQCGCGVVSRLLEHGAIGTERRALDNTLQERHPPIADSGEIGDAGLRWRINPLRTVLRLPNPSGRKRELLAKPCRYDRLQDQRAAIPADAFLIGADRQANGSDEGIVALVYGYPCRKQFSLCGVHRLRQEAG